MWARSCAWKCGRGNDLLFTSMRLSHILPAVFSVVAVTGMSNFIALLFKLTSLFSPAGVWAWDSSNRFLSGDKSLQLCVFTNPPTLHVLTSRLPMTQILWMEKRTLWQLPWRTNPTRTWHYAASAALFITRKLMPWSRMYVEFNIRPDRNV